MSAACGCFLLLVFVVVLFGWLYRCQRKPSTILGPEIVCMCWVERLLKPCTPLDCVACCLLSLGRLNTLPERVAVIPWSSRKSRRGAPKRISTEGFACPNTDCTYFQITDAQIHALVGDGRHGKKERMQSFRCQACRTTFSARRDTPLYHLKTPSWRVAEVLSALAEGLDIAAATRVFDHRHATISSWLSRAGEHSATLHQQCCSNLHLPHIQLDEICTRLRSRAHKLWLWLALDPITKLVPVLHLGTRTHDVAHTVIHELRQRLAPSCLPLFRSDGLKWTQPVLLCPNRSLRQLGQVTGRRTQQWQIAAELLYGQLKKRYRRRKLVGVTPVMRCGTLSALSSSLRQLGLSGRLNTAFVERLNLTIRQSVAPLMRRSWLTAQQRSQLLLHLELWRAYYHFVRPHEALRLEQEQPPSWGGKRQPSRYRRRTPAMAAGLTRRRWTMRELVTLPLPARPIGVR